MRLPAFAKVFVCSSLLLTSACASSGASGGNKAAKRAVATTPAPGWLERAPAVEGKVYAIGHSGPTFWPQDALNNAAEDARGKLAIGLSAKMEILTKRADTGETSTHVDLVKAATDMVVQNSRVDATWVDAAGERGEAGAVWALASIEQSAAKLLGKGQAVEAATQAGVPSWLSKLPNEGGRIYAYGYSGPTFRPDDAVEYAGGDAVDNLAKALRSHVQAYQLLVENNTGLSVDEFSQTERPDDDFRDLVKKKARIETTWVDAKGIRPGYPAGSVWSLAWVDVGSTKGAYQNVANDDTGPALTATGEIGDGQKRKAAEPKPAGAGSSATAPTAAGSAVNAATSTAPVANPASTPLAQPIPASTTVAPKAPSGTKSPGSGRQPSSKLAPYPSAGEKCKPGYESTGGWCLPPGE